VIREDNFGVEFRGLALTRCDPSGILFNLGIRCVSFCAVPVEIGALHRRFQPADLGTSGHRRKEEEKNFRNWQRDLGEV
jgi:hypothetical protein